MIHRNIKGSESELRGQTGVLSNFGNNRESWKSSGIDNLPSATVLFLINAMCRLHFNVKQRIMNQWTINVTGKYHTRLVPFEMWLWLWLDYGVADEFQYLYVMHSFG